MSIGALGVLWGPRRTPGDPLGRLGQAMAKWHRPKDAWKRISVARPNGKKNKKSATAQQWPLCEALAASPYITCFGAKQKSTVELGVGI